MMAVPGLAASGFDDVASPITGPHVAQVVGDHSVGPGAMAQILGLSGAGVAPRELAFLSQSESRPHGRGQNPLLFVSSQAPLRAC